MWISDHSLPSASSHAVTLNFSTFRIAPRVVSGYASERAKDSGVAPILGALAMPMHILKGATSPAVG